MLRRFLLLPLLFAVTACGQAAPPLTASPTATTSPTLTATQTKRPTPTLMASATPFPLLSGEKPYLMVQEDRQIPSFSIYDTNGGRKLVELPSDGYIRGINTSLKTIVSPNGQWLVFYTGAANYLSGNTTRPVTLKLLNLSDGTVKTIADVALEGYEEKLGQLANKLKKLYPDGWLFTGLVKAFEQGIYSIAWSPDSQTLAFAAQINGLSSDVYLYNMQSGTIQQAEDSLQSVDGICWSPDGKKIIFKNTEPGDLYSGAPELHIITPEKTAIKNPKTISAQTWIGSFDWYTQTWSSTAGWLSPNLLLVTGQTPDAGLKGIDSLNINTGQLTSLWKDIFTSYAIDEKNKIILVNASEYSHSSNLGVYFISFNGQKTKIFDGLYWLELFFRGGEKHRFLAQGISNQPQAQYPILGDVVGLGLDGKPTFLGKFSYQNISISPDYAFLLMWDEDKLYLYDKNDELLKTFPIPGIKRAIWQPDAQRIFYATDKDLFTISLPDGTPKWVDSVSIYDTIWLP